MARFSNQIIRDLGRGVDLRSAPNSIPEGFSQRLENVDTNSSGFLSKRAGYEGYYGYLPVRVTSVEHSGTEIKFTLGGGINTTELASTPILVYGKLSGAQSGDLSTTAAAKYYTSFTTDVPELLTAAGSSVTIPESRHGIATDTVFIETLEATALNEDSSLFFPSYVRISDTSAYDVDVGYSIPSDINAFIYIKQRDTAGEAYSQADTVNAGTSSTITISAGTHGLNNFNIMGQIYSLESGEWVRCTPDAFTVNFSTGEVNVDITNSSGSNISFMTVLAAAPLANTASTTVAAGSSDTIVISSTNNFHFTSVYEISGATRTQIIPDYITVDDAADTITIGLTNGGVAEADFTAIYDFGTITSSSIIVEDLGDVDTDYTDAAPQLTLWGLAHSDLYNTSTAQEGHVSHIDSYRREAENRLIAGIGGNLFSAQTRTESGSTYSIPFSTVEIAERVASDVDVAPLFATTAATTTRTRAHVYADTVVANKVLITAATLSAANEVTYTLDLTNKSGTLAASVDVTAGQEDYITVTGMANSINNGTFMITAVDDTLNTITVYNSAATLAIYDETGALGRGLVDTDQVTISSVGDYLPGDILTSAPFITNNATIKSVNGTTLVLSGLVGESNLPTGLELQIQRTSNVLPLTSSSNFVKGDICEILNPIVSDVDILTAASGNDTLLSHKVRVKYVVPSAITISSITFSGGVGTATTSAAHLLSVGQDVLITRSGSSDVDGVRTIVSTPSATTFTIASSETTTVSSATIQGNTIQIDESITFTDVASATTELRVQGRWIPIEAPTTSDGLPSATYVRHLDGNSYVAQDTLRSTMVSDTLFGTNYSDEVYKFDGTSIYQAGLIPWKAGGFAQVDTTTASIPANPISGAVSADVGNKFTVAAGTAQQFVKGDRVIHTNDSEKYTVIAVDTTNEYVFVDKTISGTGGNLRIVNEFRYYFRLSAIDANNNIVASACTNPEDFTIELGSAGQIHIRLISPPEWGNLDYDTIELQVYRTKANTSGPFYLANNVDVSFSTGDTYIDIKDGTLDETLTDFDPVMTKLKGAELGLSWTIPPRAKYITSSNNKLILAHITDYPKLDMTLRKNPTSASFAIGDLNTKLVRLRKDTTTTSTTTDMINIVNYEFVNSGAVTITPNTDITRDATTFTVASTAHGLVAGNWVYMYHAAAGENNELDFAGWWQIASVNTDDFTINHNNTKTPATVDVDTYVAATAPADVPVWIGTDGNYTQAFANKLDNETAVTRLAQAVNASMRATDVSVSGFETFTPFVIAEAGSTLNYGQIIFSQPRSFSTTFSVYSASNPTSGIWFINGVKLTAAAETNSRTQVFPSRVAISYENYPEIFDSPTEDQINSDSVVEINSADGQEITGIIPFFGASVFNSGLAEDSVVVFKTNSVYLLNVSTREISKLQTRGQGCTAPFSISQTREGIMFANESGVYRLNRDLSIAYVGKNIERLWQDELNKDQISKATGHHYGVGRKYKLSIPYGDGQTTNNRVLVYDHQREGDGQEFGAWTTYTNHNATGWANLANNAFFATTDGQVFRVRNTGDKTDFRDDSSAVDTMVAELRPEDFGTGGERKIVGNVTTHFQMRYSDMIGTSLQVIPDNTGVGVSAGQFSLTKSVENEIKTVMSSYPRRKMVYVTLKYENSTKDEDVIIAGIDYRVALLSSGGVTQRAQTS